MSFWNRDKKSKEDADKAYMEREVRSMIDAYKMAHANAPGAAERKNAYQTNVEFLKGKHWRDRDGQFADAEKKLPSIGLTWRVCQIHHAKIFHGYEFKPEVVPESEENFILDPKQDGPNLRRAIANNAGALTEGTDTEKAARLRTALLDYWWDKQNMMDVVEDAVEMAQAFGDSWVLDYWEDEKPKARVIHPADMFVDPDAECDEDLRWIGYKVTRTIEAVGQDYPDHVDEIHRRYNDSMDSWDAYQKKYENDPYNPEKDLVDVETWFIKELDTVTETINEVVNDPVQVQEMLDSDEGWEVDEDETVYEYADGDDAGVPVEWTLKRDVERDKYPGGWRRIVYCQGVVLEDGENPSASGNLPLTHIRYYNTPGEYWGMSLVQHLMPMNLQFNELLYQTKMIAQTMRPFIAMDSSKLTFETIQRVNNVYDVPIFKFNSKANAQDMMTSLSVNPGADVPPALMEFINKYQNWIELISDSYDLRNQNNIPQDASGKWVEAVESAGQARIGQVRKHVRNAVKKISLNVLANSIYHMEGERRFRAKIGAREQDLVFDPSDLDTDGFEVRFDIVVGGSDSLPSNPIDRNQFVIGLIDSLAQKPFSLAMAELELLDLPNKEQIRAALEEHNKQMEQAAQSQPNMSEKSTEEYHQSVAGVLESVADEEAKRGNSFAALVIAQQLQAKADGGQVDYQAINKVVSKPIPGVPVGPGPQQGVQ